MQKIGPRKLTKSTDYLNSKGLDERAQLLKGRRESWTYIWKWQELQTEGRVWLYLLWFSQFYLKIFGGHGIGKIARKRFHFTGQWFSSFIGKKNSKETLKNKIIVAFDLSQFPHWETIKSFMKQSSSSFILSLDQFILCTKRVMEAQVEKWELGNWSVLQIPWSPLLKQPGISHQGTLSYKNEGIPSWIDQSACSTPLKMHILLRISHCGLVLQ